MIPRPTSSLPMDRQAYLRYVHHYLFQLWKPVLRLKKSRGHLEFLCLMIMSSFLLNVILTRHLYQCSLVEHLKNKTSINGERSSDDRISPIERSSKALAQLKQLLDSVRSPNDPPWIWTPSRKYPSVPYQPSTPVNRTIPKSLSNVTDLPQVVTEEISRVCQRLKRAHSAGGEIWCQLFNKSYSDTLATTTSLLDDNSTFIITGDIDLMWLRDSSAQVHHYLSLWNDSSIQRIIEGLIRRQTEFVFANPYASSFRLTLRPNPPSDDSLEAQHTQKGRNVHVAMHNYELDSLCYHLRLSYSWWKASSRRDAFQERWLIGLKIIIQLFIVEQHHSQVSPYRYTELKNHFRGPPVAYTGMTWSAFRPSDDRTQHGYLIPSNMMASVVLKQLNEMIGDLFPEQSSLLKQINQLRSDILSGIHHYGVVTHPGFGRMYAFETDGFSEHLLEDDANVPSLLSASYLGFHTPYDPHDRLIFSTRLFVLSRNNSQYFSGKYGSGVGSDHTGANLIWPMSIIMEAFSIESTNRSHSSFNSIWTRLEGSHAGTFAMHESFDVDDPKRFTRPWFAWASSLLAELILTRLEHLEAWLGSRSPPV